VWKNSAMPLNDEIVRLRDLLPATGRMKSRLVSDARQSEVIKTEFPKPWKVTHPVSINFELWGNLSEAQRDLLFLRETCWLSAVNVLKLDLYQGIAAAGLLGFMVELAQLDAIGMISAGGLSAFAGSQIWRNSRNDKAEIEADEAAIQVAQRRGYSQREAAQHLLEAIEAVAHLENRSSSFSELLRCQNLRLTAGA
jgi:Protein of unknown function (DUF3318)